MTLRETFFRFSRDFVRKSVLDLEGYNAGKVYDVVVVLQKDEAPLVIGLVAQKKFIPWNMVAAVGDDIRLNKRWFTIGPNPMPGNSVFLRHVLDEQLVDTYNKALGRVDDMVLMHDATSHTLCLSHIISGPFARIGIGMGGREIPWQCIEQVRKTRPTAVVLRLDKLRSSSVSTTDKMVVKFHD